MTNGVHQPERTLASLYDEFAGMARKHGLGTAVVRLAVWPFRPVVTLWGYLMFIGANPRQWHLRVDIIRRFRWIQKALKPAHTEYELLWIAGQIMAIPASLEGDIIECGAYNGGASCKLSIIAKLVSRKVYVCDSFSGLPEPSDDERHLFKKAQYLGTIDEVRDNLVRLGEPECVELVPGWFHTTLPTLSERKFVLILEDADLSESIKCCIEHLWPALQPEGIMVTHEMLHHQVIRPYRDTAFWLSKFGCDPPTLRHVGVWPYVRTNHLGYLKKPRVRPS